MTGSRYYTESIKFEAVNPSTCNTGSWLFRFLADGHQVEIQANSDEALLIEFTPRKTAIVTYKNSRGEQESHEIPYPSTQKTITNLGNSSKQFNSFAKPHPISQNNEIFIADVGDETANFFKCEICKRMQTVKDIFFGDGKGGTVDDFLGTLTTLSQQAPDRWGSSGSALINLLLSKLYDLDESLKLNCENRDFCKKEDNTASNSNQNEPCTVCTCCVYTAQYRYSNGHVSGGTFNAPCKGSIEQIIAKINSDLARDIARRQLPYTATVVGTPQRNTQPPPECEDRKVVDVTARISQIDDVATIYVDGRKVKEGGYAGGGKGGDTGWGPIDVGHGTHQVRLVVNNTISGQSGGWFEIKVNGELKINQGRRFQDDRVTGIKYDQTTTLEVP